MKETIFFFFIFWYWLFSFLYSRGSIPGGGERQHHLRHFPEPTGQEQWCHGARGWAAEWLWCRLWRQWTDHLLGGTSSELEFYLFIVKLSYSSAITVVAIKIQNSKFKISSSPGWNPQGEVWRYQQDRVCPCSHPGLPCRPGFGLVNREPVLHQSGYAVYWGELSHSELLLLAPALNSIFLISYCVWSGFEVERWGAVQENSNHKYWISDWRWKSCWYRCGPSTWVSSV